MNLDIDSLEIKATYNGVLFRKKNTDEWFCFGSNYHGEFGLGYFSSVYIKKSNPIKVPWKADEVITDGGYHLFFRKESEWFVMGDNNCGQLGLGENMPGKIFNPIRSSIQNIVKVFTHPNKTYIVVQENQKEVCYVAGNNHYGELGLGENSPMMVFSFTKVDWIPKKILHENLYTIILMNDGKWYELGANYDEQQGLMRKIDGGYPNNILYPTLCQRPYTNPFSDDEVSIICQECKFSIVEKSYHNKKFCDDCLFRSSKLDGKDLENYNRKKLLEEDINLPDLGSLLINKYEPLKQYFENLRTADLTNLNSDDLVNYVIPEHKVLMKLFIKEHLWSILRCNFDHLDTDYDAKFQEFSLDPNEEGFLDLRRKVHTNSFATYSDPISLVTLCSSIKHNDKIQILDISDCNLWDQDVKLIRELVANLPNLRILKLGKNHFNGRDSGGLIKTRMIQIDDDFKAMLNLENIEYVDITGTCLASITRKDFLNKLNLKQISKLIWIAVEWLYKGNWNTIINDKNLIEIILKQHEKYHKDKLTKKETKGEKKNRTVWHKPSKYDLNK